VDGGTLGLGLVALLEGCQRVIFVDAADMGQAPGQFVRFMPEEARLLGGDERITIHEAGLRDALLLAQALNVLPDQVVIFGVQPAKLDWDSTLSPEVEATLPSLIAAIQIELSDHRLRNKEEEGHHG
jgi:hydrogenase maturation protease